MAKATFTERLKRLTRAIKEKTPDLSWREAQHTARSQLYANNTFPSYDAGVKEFWWKNEGLRTANTGAETPKTDPTSPTANAEEPTSSENAPPTDAAFVEQQNSPDRGQENVAND